MTFSRSDTLFLFGADFSLNINAKNTDFSENFKLDLKDIYIQRESRLRGREA